MQSTQVCVWSPFSHSLSHLLFRSYALVEFKHSDDAKYALRKLDSQRIDGSKWLVDPANVKDFKYFDWTPSSSVSSPQSFFSLASAVGKTVNVATVPLVMIFPYVSRQHSQCFCRLIHGTQLPWMSEASL
jgi:RNA recognition motif-containing protein